ncbi:hypothetical protein SASPL_114550 [Salvia splendens]|uniref:Uncharacterized protein n=1 Tax=Salvia splendens TaxID=180675 RepID=A0A8X9A0H3_SALSN|nr:hypothetical protein SASPL_114550 [Salvia splendens]
MAPKTSQFEYDFNKDKAVQNSSGLVYSKNVRFEQFGNFETTVKFTIAPNDTPPYDDGLVFFIDTAEYKDTHSFALVCDHSSDNPDYLNLGIIIDESTYVSVPNEFLGKELTLVGSYVGDTHEIKASITDGSQTFQVSSTYDLGPKLKDFVSVGLTTYPTNIDVSYWAFNATAP